MSASVSIVIPCFNQARFLRDAIDSTRASTLQPEVIVIDDGSTDDTAAVAAAAGVECIRQPNSGLVSARNRGLAAARGDFVVFLDADDRLLPGALDAGAAALSNDPHCALAWGRCVMMNEAGALLDTPSTARVEQEHHAALLRNNFIWTPAAAMLRTRAVRELRGFAHGFDAAADYDLYLRLTRTHAAYDHGRLVAAYRKHASNMSGHASVMLRDTLGVMARNRPSGGPLEAAWREGRHRWKDFYGTQLVEEIRRGLRAGERAAVARKTFVLARFAPGVFLREARKKTAAWVNRNASASPHLPTAQEDPHHQDRSNENTVTHAGRAIPAAEISSPIRRADSSSGS